MSQTVMPEWRRLRRRHEERRETAQLASLGGGWVPQRARKLTRPPPTPTVPVTTSPPAFALDLAQRIKVGRSALESRQRPPPEARLSALRESEAGVRTGSAKMRFAQTIELRRARDPIMTADARGQRQWSHTRRVVASRNDDKRAPPAPYDALPPRSGPQQSRMTATRGPGSLKRLRFDAASF